MVRKIMFWMIIVNTPVLLFLLLHSHGIPQEQPRKVHEVIIDAPTIFSPGSQVGVRVVVYESTGHQEFSPVENATVEISLENDKQESINLYSGTTNKNGTLNAKFSVPGIPEGNYTLKINTRSSAGESLHSSEVKVKRDIKILLVTDKPLYQPNQTIHLRALALDSATLIPLLSREILFEIEDPKGNKVFKKKIACSEFGIASTDFKLADEINLGTYKITATLGEAKTTKTVEIKKYTLPKFKVEVQTDKKFYLPKETIKGKINAYYFFGKSLEEAEVIIKARKFDVDFTEFANVKLTLDKDGKGEFEIPLPDYFIGRALERGIAFVNLQISVKDKAGQTQKVEKNINVSSTAMNIVCIPESGELVPDIENIIYAAIYYPDGSPAKATLKIKTPDKETTLDTDNTGFAFFTYTPRKEHIQQKYEEWQDPLTGEKHEQRDYCEIQVEAKDTTGAQLATRLDIPVKSKVDNLLVRLDKAIYKQGETINCTVFSTSKIDTIFLDIVRKGQTYFMDTIDIQQGRGEYRFAIPQDLFGNVELHVYKILKDGQVVRDSRLIYIYPASELNIKVSLDKEVYLPAEEAIIKFKVEDRNGLPVQSAIGVVVVDEAVYALQEIQPGLEKIYFTLEQEIAKPRYQIKTQYQMTDIIREEKEIEQARQNIATMILANTIVPYNKWRVNTIAQRQKEFEQKVKDIAERLKNYIQNNIKNASKFTYIDPAAQERRFKENLVDIAVNEGIFKQEECLDPWGRNLTYERLRGIEPSLKFEDLTCKWSDSFYNIAEKIEEVAGSCTLVEYDVNKKQWIYKDEMLRGILKLKEDELKDCWGDTITDERFAKILGAGTVARVTDDIRKELIFDKLVEYAIEHPEIITVIDKQFRYKSGIFEDLVREKRVAEETMLNIFTGKNYNLDELINRHPEFSPENIAEAIDVNGMSEIIKAIQKFTSEKSVFDILFYDQQTNAYVLKEDVIDLLVKQGYLQEKYSRSVAGEKFNLPNLISKIGTKEIKCEIVPIEVIKDVVYRKQYKIYQEIQRHWYCRLCGDFHLPSGDILDMLLNRGVLKEEELKDPWGNKFKFVVNPIDIVSAGHDGKFDTQDDIKIRDNSYYYYSRLWAPSWYNRYHRQVSLEYQWRHEWISAFALAHSVFEEEIDELKLGIGAGGGRAKKEDRFQQIRRIREWFPETLYWNAQIITDNDGKAEVKIPLADSITSWRLTAMANSKNGVLGSITKDIRVFQDFFIDIDFPVFLTQNDIVSVPIAVFNYLKESQKVKLVVQKEKWFELMDEEEKIIQLEANEVRPAYFKIKVKDIGYNKFTVLAYGTKMSDAISRGVEVVPDGKKFEVVINDRLAREQTHTISIPEGSIKDSYKLIFKVYPGIFSQIIDGLDGLFRIPYGCFEQTSSIAYPNVLTLLYLKKTGRTKPEVVMRALEYISLGYQRLLTFEVPGGGFHWWGHQPANRILSAWGLLEFTDMAKVYEIDPGVIERTKKWLLNKQNKEEGWWLEEALSYTWSGVSGKLAQTAYIAWALLEAGQKGKEIEKAIKFIKDNIAQAKDDPYTLGLIANALVLYNPEDKVLESILGNLDDIKKEEREKGICYWETSRPTFYYATGRAGSVEATSLIALAMIRANMFHSTVNKALSFIVKSRDASGTWGSTQATILALRTLIIAMTGTEPQSDISIKLSVNGKEYTVNVAKDQWDVMQILDLKEITKTGDNQIKITADAEGANLMYQIIGRYFLPWSMIEPVEEIEAITFKVEYDRTKLKVDDMLVVKVTMKYHGQIPTYMVIVDLGIPAGFSVMPDAFEKMLEEGKIKKFSITGRQIILYFGEVKPQQEITFEYQLRAKYPIKVKTPTSQAYEYYTPENRAISSPVELEVE